MYLGSSHLQGMIKNSIAPYTLVPLCKLNQI